MRELSGWIGLLTVPPVPPFPEELWGRKVCGIVWCCTGRHDRAEAVLEPVKTFGSPLMVGLQPMPFRVLQSTFDPLYPAGLQWVLAARTSSTRSPMRRSRCTANTVRCCQPAIPRCICIPSTVRPAGGRGRDRLRLPGRRLGGHYRGRRPRTRRTPTWISQWTKDYWRELHPSSAGGAYVNFLMDEGQDRIRAAYRGNYDRLAQLKERYDPDNVFHVNQNIRPASDPGR